jgi:hypothetical protein
LPSPSCPPSFVIALDRLSPCTHRGVHAWCVPPARALVFF